MKQFVLSSIAVLGLVLVALALVAISRERLDRARVYTVAEVQAKLAHDPEAWLHRTLRVRGIAVAAGCAGQTPDSTSLCGPPHFSLSDADPSGGPARLTLVWAGGSPLLTALRRLPLLGRFAPAPQEIRWEVVAVYRVRLQEDPRCSACYEVLLPDTVL